MLGLIPLSKAFAYCGRGMWNMAVYGDRDWDLRNRQERPIAGDYYFNDTPLSAEDTTNDLVRGALTADPKKFLEWTK